MAEISVLDLLKEKNHYRVEDERSTGSNPSVGQTTQSLRTASGGAPNAGTLESGSGSVQSVSLVEESVFIPEKSSAPSPTTSPISGASKEPDVCLPDSVSIKSLLKISPKKPDKLAIVAVDTIENPTGPSAAKTSVSQNMQPQDQIRNTFGELPNTNLNFLASIISCLESGFKEDAERKVSISSCDTGAHICSLESSSGMEPEKYSQEKEYTRELGASPLKPDED